MGREREGWTERDVDLLRRSRPAGAAMAARSESNTSGRGTISLPPSTPKLLIFSAVTLAAVFGSGIVHEIPDGHVGVYWRAGSLLKTLSEPGFHLMMPFLTRYTPIQVTVHLDQTNDIPCDTKEGVRIYFEKTEVVYRLHKEYVYETIFNHGVGYKKTWIDGKIHHEIHQFCKSHALEEVHDNKFDQEQIENIIEKAIRSDCTKDAPGIEIIAIRVTKPIIPPSVARIYEMLQEERRMGLIALEKQKIAEKEAETLSNLARKKAEAEKERIERQQQEQIERDIVNEILNREARAEQQQIAEAEAERVLNIEIERRQQQLEEELYAEFCAREARAEQQRVESAKQSNSGPFDFNLKNMNYLMVMLELFSHRATIADLINVTLSAVPRYLFGDNKG